MDGEMIVELLAQSEVETEKVLPWVTNFVIAVLGVVFAKSQREKGRDEGKRQVKIEPSPLPVEVAKSLATKEQLDEIEEKLEGRIEKVEGRIEKVEEAMGEERRVAREAQSNVHRRIDKVAENLAEVKGELKQLNQRLSTLIQRQLGGSGR